MGINVHGFELKQQVKIGGVDFTIIKVGTDWVEGITTECVGVRAFDSSNRNDFAASDIRAWLNGERNGDISNKSYMNGVRPVCMFDTEVLREHICCFDEIRVKMEELSKAITKSTAEMGTVLDELYRLLQEIHRDKDDCVALYPLRGENKSCRKEQTCL